MKRNVTKNISVVLLVFFVLFALSKQNYASNIEVTDEYDLKLALNYAYDSDIDSLILVTNGGTYTTEDTAELVIKEPLTIVAADGLTEKPVITHLDTSIIEQFIVCNDLTVDGVIFEGGGDLAHGFKYCMRFRHTPQDFPGGQVFAKEGTDIKFRNCEFRNFIQDKVKNYVASYDGYEVGEGHVMKFQNPEAGEPTLKGGTLLFENCKFNNIGDEAIRLSDIEKYPSGEMPARVVDSLIVRNCTFKNVYAECVRIYADPEPEENMQTEDAYILMDHLTIDSCAPRVTFCRDNAGTIFSNSLITNARKARFYRSDRNDAVVNLQRDGSVIFNVDTFNVTQAIDEFERGDDLHVFELVEDDYPNEDTLSIYGFDPMYEDAANEDYTLKENSPAYKGANDGIALGNLNWATNSTNRYKLTLSIEGQGGLELKSPDYFAPTYAPDESITLSAVEKVENWEFTNWSGDVSGDEKEINFTMDSPKDVILNFNEATSVKKENIPMNYSLKQNYPNPFNPATNISFAIKKQGFTTLKIYNILGELVATPVKTEMQAGEYEINFDGSGLASGVYYYKLVCNNYVAVKKMILLK